MLPIFKIIEQKSGVPDEELYQVFNMGIGMVGIVSADKADAVLKFIKSAETQSVDHRRSRQRQGQSAGRIILPPKHRNAEKTFSNSVPRWLSGKSSITHPIHLHLRADFGRILMRSIKNNF